MRRLCAGCRLPAVSFVGSALRPIPLRDIIPIDCTGQPAIRYVEETTRVHGAAERAQGAFYAELNFAFTDKTSGVRNIIDSLPITTRSSRASRGCRAM